MTPEANAAAYRSQRYADEAAERIVQLIPYSGRPFADKYTEFYCPIAWALCDDGQVHVVVLDTYLGRSTYVSKFVNWWD